MNDLARNRLPEDLRQFSRIMAEVGTLETGQSLMNDAAKEIDLLRDIAAQSIAVIESVQTYEQPMDPTCENALTMCEHEVFDFDVEAARNAAGIKLKEGSDAKS